ncbi:phage holin family protein [Sphingomicrobium sp. XHP0239]|uniref:phage holin family protein n=1 Tax=Sphingomicrobium maritimum TaxID=3133972 RepID=UPI0031CC668C
MNPEPRHDENIVDLVGKLSSQSAHLAQQQINLVQAEMRETSRDIKASIGGMMGAAVLGIAGLGVTLMGIAYLIGDAMGDRDLATLLVGLATLLIAGIVYASAKSKLDKSNLAPTRTIETVERAPDAVAHPHQHEGTAS